MSQGEKKRAYPGKLAAMGERKREKGRKEISSTWLRGEERRGRK